MAAEAEAAIAVVVASDPMYQPTETEASPRVRTAFSEVRQRQLPDIARTRYASAKSAFDRKDYQSAEQQFRELLRLIDDPDMGGRLGDLRLLVNGFVDLSTAAAAPPRPSRPGRSRAAKRRRRHRWRRPRPIRRKSSRWTTKAWPCRRRSARTCRVCRCRSRNQTRDRGILEIVIDEQGRVINATIRVSLHPIYDAQILVAARDWKYSPALAERPACEIP